MALAKVIAVEDDRGMQDFYRRFFDTLQPQEFSASVVPDAEQALDALRADPIDVLIVDWGLPRISGIDLVRAVRAHPKTHQLGILMVTARDTATDTVDALESGADDFIAKPFEERVLLARLHSVVRRRNSTRDPHEVYRLPGLTLDVPASKLTVDGRTVRLSPKEVELLRLFLSRPDMLHSSAFLWDAVWGYASERSEHVLAVTISRLRAKMGPRWGPHLVAHRGRGYGFNV